MARFHPASAATKPTSIMARISETSILSRRPARTFPALLTRNVEPTEPSTCRFDGGPSHCFVGNVADHDLGKADGAHLDELRRLCKLLAAPADDNESYAAHCERQCSSAADPPLRTISYLAS
jgi:hypothetical protein